MSDSSETCLNILPDLKTWTIFGLCKKCLVFFGFSQSKTSAAVYHWTSVFNSTEGVNFEKNVTFVSLKGSWDPGILGDPQNVWTEGNRLKVFSCKWSQNNIIIIIIIYRDNLWYNLLLNNICNRDRPI